MPLTDANGAVSTNASNTATLEVPHTSTANSRASLRPLTESQTQALGSQESNIEHNQASSSAAKPLDRLLPVSESLGLSGLLGAVGGSLCVLGVFGFLTFLWFGYGSKPEAADATALWRFIALHNYFPQTITPSTILKSDVNDFTIVEDQNTTQFGDLLLYKKEDFHVFGSSSIAFLPPVYAVFGETQADFNVFPSANGLSDTGIIQRALLPIPGSDARSSLREIEATSFVLTSQSACLRPRINGMYTAGRFDIGSDSTTRYIVGTLDYKRSFEDTGVNLDGLCSDIGCEKVPFECAIPAAVKAEWQAIVCLFRGLLGTGSINRLAPSWDPADGVVVVATNINSEGWQSLANGGVLPAGNPYQEWQSYEVGTNQFLNISLCSFGFSVSRFDTLMSTPRPLREPKFDLDMTSLTPSSTEDVQNFLGVNGFQRSHSERGILDLRILGTPAGDNASSPASQITDVTYSGYRNVTVGKLTTDVLEDAIYLQFSPGALNTSILLCYFCVGYGYEANPRHGALFSDIIAETGRAANALLSYTTVTFATAYYTFLTSLRVRQDARIVAITNVATPGPCSINGCPGYISVATLLFIHLLCVTVVMIVYVWQLAGDGLADMLQEGQHASDAKVERIVDKGNKNYRVKVGRERARGPIEVIRI
ncbi:hypothetical protein O1611_g5555 [Lasiodiplodia mahajangana]|uniref:Uncharacterized protein n=1 Tax=Lasiodiplodia mahajangana TaxID=1108764 RepID=A0ACC2JKV4_9PEZI|nr:hypothetical protein O1611_g5555 [Lasiodiplodia mahajangana]